MSLLRTSALLGLFFAVSVLTADELRPLSGGNVTGTLKSIDADNLVMQTDAGPVSTPLSQVLLLDLRPVQPLPADAKIYDVRLLDDSVVVAREVAYTAKEVELTLLSGTKLKLPMSTIVSVLKDAQD